MKIEKYLCDFCTKNGRTITMFRQKPYTKVITFHSCSEHLDMVRDIITGIMTEQSKKHYGKDKK